MPRIGDTKRKQYEDWAKRDREFQERLDAKYHRKQKRHAQCRLCGEMLSATEPDSVWDALDLHEKAHPEYEEWRAIGRDFWLTEAMKSLHYHDCVYAKCACLCGCTAQICVADAPEEKRQEPMLCGLCELYQGRGHLEHSLGEIH